MSEKKSGARYRREKKEREKLEAQASGDTAKLVDDLTDGIGEDPDDPLASLDWVRQLQARALNVYIRDPSTTLREKFRAVKEMGDSIGKTENRRALESEVKELREAVSAMMARIGGVKLEPSSAISKPNTARNSRGRRGPRKIPGHDPGSPSGED